MDYPKVANATIYSSFLLLLLLLLPPIRNMGFDPQTWSSTIILAFSAALLMILAFGTDFTMLNTQVDWPKRREWVLAVFIGTATWYLLASLFVYSRLDQLYSLGLFFMITLLLFVLSLGFSAKSLGISIILPFSLVTFIYLFYYTALSVSAFGLFYAVLLPLIELGLLVTLIALRKRKPANYAVSLLMLGAAMYGVRLEAVYYNNYLFYVDSLVAMMVSLALITSFHTRSTLKSDHKSYSEFFDFGNTGRLLLVLVSILFAVGFFLLMPIQPVYPVPVYSPINYILALVFGVSVFYYMDRQSFNKVTNTVTFILLSGVALYGLRYIVLNAPAYTIGPTPKYPLWLILSVLVMYEPSLRLLTHVTGHRIDRRFGIVSLIENWKNRSKLLHSRYIISQQPFNQGGTANIYQAFDVKKRQDVIIKIPVITCKNLQCDFRGESVPTGGKCPKCKTQLDVQDFSEAIKLLKDEITALSFLDSPYVVKQLDHFDEGSPVKTYLVEEMVAGTNFADKFTNKPVGEKEMLTLIEKVLHGLNHAHMHGIIHRDLNARNLMVTGSGDVKILDFGTAKFKARANMSNGKPSIGAKFGTEFFSPPESYFISSFTRTPTNREPTFSYDIYSVGCIMYLMLTGNLPTPLIEIKNKIVSNMIPTIYPTKSYREDFERDLKSRCSGRVLDIMLKATMYDPGDRYQSAFEMICAIKQLSGEFIVTNTEQAYRLPPNPPQPFSSEIVLEFKEQVSHPPPSFDTIKGPITVELKSNSGSKQPIKYKLTYDSNQQQYRLSPGKYDLYYWRLENGRLVSSKVKESGVYLGRSIMLFSHTNSLADVVFAYYRVGKE